MPNMIFARFNVKFCYIYLANTQKDKTRQESTPINNMLYFSSEVKMEGPKKK